MFDRETTAKMLWGGGAVDFNCHGCLRPVRVVFDHFEDGRSIDSCTVSAVLEYEAIDA